MQNGETIRLPIFGWHHHPVPGSVTLEVDVGGDAVVFKTGEYAAYGKAAAPVEANAGLVN